MRKLLKKHLQNEKGLTLIELLVVVVILGIIAAIAIVAVTGILDNSKKDAHIANAKTMAEAARIAIAQNGSDVNADSQTGEITYTMQQLIDGGFLDSVPKSPGKMGEYSPTASKIVAKKGTGNSFSYYVKLIDGGSKPYIDGTVTNGTPVDKLGRGDVNLK